LTEAEKHNRDIADNLSIKEQQLSSLRAKANSPVSIKQPNTGINDVKVSESPSNKNDKRM
jgi:hypothetical protein